MLGGTSLNIQTILNLIDLGKIALPEFQRGYVWNRDQVRSFLDSLYRRHPTGSLLIWSTTRETAKTRGDSDGHGDTVDLLLDGQQRMTTLYGVVRGRPPRFFDGNDRAFTGLYFSLDEESFEFYAPAKMKGNPLWVSVTAVMKHGAAEAVKPFLTSPELLPKAAVYLDRLNRLNKIVDTDIHIDYVTGEDMSIDIVVDIFNKVNSGGTKLSKGDLALAKVCAEWPDARESMKIRLAKWQRAGFTFNLDWLLRNLTTMLTGDALFSALRRVDSPAVQEGLDRTERAVDYLLNLISSRLGLDHDAVLGGRYAFPVMTRHIDMLGKPHLDYREQGKLLYWYIHSFLWGRFTSSVESTLNQDLRLVDGSAEGIDRLIDQLRRSRGGLEVRPEDFDGWSLGARFYPMLYLMTRTCHSRDWGTGSELSAHLLGRGSTLNVHHVFPKSVLYKAGYSRPEVNAIANFCFQTQETNLALGNRVPEDYFAEVGSNHPGALESQWIPMDRELWTVGNYRGFLAARRELLARAANRLLASMLDGGIGLPDLAALPEKVVAAEQMLADPELVDLKKWLEERGMPMPSFHYEVVDPETGDVVTNVDAAWPTGVQSELSGPVALVLDGVQEVAAPLSQLGYKLFTSVNKLQSYLTDVLDGERG